MYIANLPPYMSESELEEMLKPYGTVISTRILRDPGMNSRGVGFARYVCLSFMDILRMSKKKSKM